jgi:Putative metallopeptidase
VALAKELVVCALRLFIAVTWVFLGASSAVTASEAQPQRIRIEYVSPQNPAHQSLYELIKERRVLEKLQEILSPFRLPSDLTIRTVGCDGQSNAWFQNASLTLCYEYLDEIRKNVPKETTRAGITPADAVVGQFFYVVAHEFGHAVFNMLEVPTFGGAEEIADQFSAYMMLLLGKNEARRLIGGAAYSYKAVLENPNVFLPIKAFSDVHGMPAQRFYNLLCMAYGADPVMFKDIVEDKYLPKEWAADCGRSYHQVAFAFQKLIAPHIDKGLAEKVLEKTWLPEQEKARQP